MALQLILDTMDLNLGKSELIGFTKIYSLSKKSARLAHMRRS